MHGPLASSDRVNFRRTSPGARESDNRTATSRRTSTPPHRIGAGRAVPLPSNPANTFAIAIALCLVAPHALRADDAAAIRGVVRPVNQAAFSTDLVARATSLPFKEGERFRKGDVIAAFDCRRQRAEVAGADATLREMRLTLDSHLHLERHGAGVKTDVEIARARAAKAEADVRALAARIELCEVIAPFDGRVVELAVRPHEFPSAQRPFMVVLDDSRLEVEMIVASATLAGLAPGAAFALRIDELQRDAHVTIERIGAAVDPVSQTVKVVGVLQGNVDGVLAGMSGTLRPLAKGAPM